MTIYHDTNEPEPAAGWTVICEDGTRNGPFVTYQEAGVFAWWGHACTDALHDVVVANTGATALDGRMIDLVALAAKAARDACDDLHMNEYDPTDMSCTLDITYRRMRLTKLPAGYAYHFVLTYENGGTINA